VVDDAKENRYLMNVYLRDYFQPIAFAENGQQAVDLIKEQPFDVIFMDLEMPELDGVSATQAIREWEVSAGLVPQRIYALTAHVDAEEKEKAINAGCDGYLIKPINKKQVLEAITNAPAGAAKSGMTNQLQI
jgi:two-component system sensor histidine kinase BarA